MIPCGKYVVKLKCYQREQKKIDNVIKDTYNVIKENTIGIEQERKRDEDIRTCHICVDCGVYMLENHAEDTT